MRDGRIVIVVGTSPALDTALDAMADLALPVRVIPAVREAQRLLLAADLPLVSAVLVHLDPSPDEALRLVEDLRGHLGFASTPVVVWAPDSAGDALHEAYRRGATSGVLLDGSDEDPVRLARMVHYWAAANEPPLQEAAACPVALHI